MSADESADMTPIRINAPIQRAPLVGVNQDSGLCSSGVRLCSAQRTGPSLWSCRDHLPPWRHYGIVPRLIANDGHLLLIDAMCGGPHL